MTKIKKTSTTKTARFKSADGTKRLAVMMRTRKSGASTFTALSVKGGLTQRGMFKDHETIEAAQGEFDGLAAAAEKHGWLPAVKAQPVSAFDTMPSPVDKPADAKPGPQAVAKAAGGRR